MGMESNMSMHFMQLVAINHHSIDRKLKSRGFAEIYHRIMKPFIDIKRLRLYLWVGLAYTLLWILYDLSEHPEEMGGRWLNEIWRAIYIVFVNFIFFEDTLPYVQRNWKKVFLPLLVIFGQIFLYSYGLYAWRFLGIQLGTYTTYAEFKTLNENVSYQFSAGVFSIFFFGIIKHIYDYIKLKQATQQLRIEKQAAELNYLKSQTNPHFLFNTLNNIYSLARDKSDLAPESILRLSKILRFMLYEAGGEYISIEKELKVIADYIALEKLRYDESLIVDFKHDVQNLNQPIPPLLLMPLVENAFKHGTSETRGRPFVDIHLTVRNSILTFIVKNSTGRQPGEVNPKENIGLGNLRRQLQLLYKDFSLFVQPNDEDFTATLKINLASHV